MNSLFNSACSSNTLGYAASVERVGEILRELENSGRIYEGNLKTNFSDVLNNLSVNSLKLKLQPVIDSIARENNVDPKLVNAVIEKESNYNLYARSGAGAVGLMQLMPQTAVELGVKNPLNPVENIRAGTKYLSSLLNRYQGNVVLALSAYNAGPGNVDKYGGVPPFEETRSYVSEIVKKLT